MSVLDALAPLQPLASLGSAARSALRELATRFGSVRVFGEMVDVLWKRGRGTSALELEVLWGRLLAAHDVDLLFAYAHTSFARAKEARAQQLDVDRAESRTAERFLAEA